MSNAKYDDHFSGRKSYYFTGNPATKAPETLVMIDIDCHDTGSLSEAKCFAEWLKTHHYSELYIEPSKRGYHAFVCVQKFGLGAETINELLGRFQQHLRDLLKESGCDVELVEIKGTLPVITWGDKKGEVNNYKSGQLALLPREQHRFEELRATTRVNAHDLFRLLSVERKKVKRVEDVKNVATISICRKATGGSISGKVIGEGELKNLIHYREVAKLILQYHQIRTTGRAVATVDDVAITLLLLKFFNSNMNADGSLPVARVRGMWVSLFKAGDINRPWEPRRFAAIRNWLSSLGLIDWSDSTYQIGTVGVKGRACKWRPSALLMELLKVLEKEEVGEIEKVEDVAVNRGREEERERTSFIVTSLLATIICTQQLSDTETIKPVPPWYQHSAEDIDFRISHFDYAIAA